MTPRIAALAAATALLHGTTATAQAAAPWDADADGVISEAEFADGFQGAGLFDDWDANDDDLIGSAELAQGLYGFWDADGDGDLSVDEWDSAVDFWFGEEDVDLAVSEWDADGDGVISEFEFSQALAETDLLARLDGNDDALLDETEVSDGLFGLADGDDDAALDVTDDGFLADVADTLAPDDPVDVAAPEPDLELIEAGEAFMQLPVPCGADGACEQVASDFCSALGYGAPIDTLAVDGQLYVIRCTDEP